MRNCAVYPKICCVYFLFLRGRLVYIGQTCNLIVRMESHAYEHKHDSLRWIVCPKEKLLEYEKRLIKILKPLANRVANFKNVKLNYKSPKWLPYYKKIRRYTIALQTGSYKNLSRATMGYYLKDATAKFKYYYRTQGYKGTFLDTTIVHPF